ncbi:MAG: sulfatase-like hydrolase/transferase, partial [Verrucomicrobiota bacterium]
FQPDPRFASNYSDVEKKSLAAFATQIEGMDKSLGDILDHLEKLGVAENTLVMFLGDNGTDGPIGGTHDVSCAAPLRGKKATHYEGGMRVPFIAAWAKPDSDNEFQKRMPIAQNAITEQLGAVYDLFPTVLAAAGGALPESKMDGVDLLPFFAPDSAAAERDFLMHFPHGHRSSYFTAYRKGDWKLVYHYRHTAKAKWEPIELFNLASDPYESKNLAKSNSAKLEEMLKSMNAALADCNAQFPLADDKETLLKPSAR